MAKPLKRLQSVKTNVFSPEKHKLSFLKSSLNYLLQDYKNLEEKIHDLSIQDVTKENVLIDLKQIFRLRKISNNRQKTNSRNSIIYKLCKEICTLVFQEGDTEKVYTLVFQEKLSKACPLPSTLSVEP